MGSLKCSFAGFAPAGGRRTAKPFSGVAIFGPCSLMVVLLVALAGCATPDRAPDLPPPVEIPESTWWRVTTT